MTDKVTIERETLQAAIDALECALSDSRPYIVKSREVSTTLRAALAAQPADEMSPEFTDTARNALLWVLWHHQGASSKVGQAMRFALGMGDHDRLTERQIADAKRWSGPVPGLAHAPVQPADAMPGGCQYPECSGDPTSCPENEGYGCCKQPADAQFEADLIESVGQMQRGEVARVWPAQPVEPAAWRIDACEGTGYPAKWHFFDKKPDGLETFTKQPLYAAPPAPAAVPPGYALVPIEPTRAMVEAYLSANSAYWERIDAMPTKIGVWRNGTPKEATEVSYRAMIAAAKPTAAVPPGMMLVPRAKLEQFRDAFAEELAAYDIDPPLHHVKQGHDDCVALLAASGEKT